MVQFGYEICEMSLNLEFRNTAVISQMAHVILKTQEQGSGEDRQPKKTLKYCQGRNTSPGPLISSTYSYWVSLETFLCMLKSPVGLGCLTGHFACYRAGVCPQSRHEVIIRGRAFSSQTCLSSKLQGKSIAIIKVVRADSFSR